jgi:hypothetical protein
MEKKKIYSYTYPKGSIRTYWGEIIAKRDSLLIRIGGVGTFEVFGNLTAETDGDKVWISGTRPDEEEKKVIEGELEA